MAATSLRSNGLVATRREPRVDSCRQHGVDRTPSESRGASVNPVNYVELDGHRVQDVEGANLGDRQYIIQSNNQAAEEAAKRCGKEDTCLSLGQKALFVAEVTSLVAGGVSVSALRLSLGHLARFGLRVSFDDLVRAVKAVKAGSQAARKALKQLAAASTEVRQTVKTIARIVSAEVARYNPEEAAACYVAISEALRKRSGLAPAIVLGCGMMAATRR